MGRKTFEAMASYWPSSTEPYAASMNAIPKLVFTRAGKIDFGVITRREERADTKDASAYIEQQKLQRLSHEEAKKNFGSWQDAKVATDLAGELKRQKAQPGKPLIAYGGAGFARELIKHDLIDEYRLVVHPVALGKGLGIFDGLEKTRKLKLISSSAFPAGATAHIFVPVR
jgi:dihydrofolate reductase